MHYNYSSPFHVQRGARCTSRWVSSEALSEEDTFMATTRIEIPYDRIAEFCRRHHIRKLSLFGSVVRDDFTPDSDVDVLVEFEPEYTPGLQFFSMQTELSQILGRPVDLNTPHWLSPRLLDDVQREQVPVYV